MSSKLLGCFRYRLSKVVSLQGLIIVWEDSLFPSHAVFYGDEFLDNSQQETIQINTREILIETRKNKPHYTYTYLPYELRNREELIGTLYMVYVVGFHANSEDFSANNIDLLIERLFCYEREYLEG